MISPAPPGQPAIKWTRVQAKLFEAIGYANTSRKLYIKFRSRPTLVYEDVPHFRYTGLMASPRQDAYYAAYIKDQFLATELPVAL